DALLNVSLAGRQLRSTRHRYLIRRIRYIREQHPDEEYAGNAIGAEAAAARKRRALGDQRRRARRPDRGSADRGAGAARPARSRAVAGAAEAEPGRSAEGIVRESLNSVHSGDAEARRMISELRLVRR